MRKVFPGIILALILIITSSPAAYAANNQIKIDGVAIASDVKPEMKNNRTMVPLRTISKNLGAKVEWSNSEVTLTKNKMKVTLKPNSSTAVKNGEKVQLDVKPYVKNNRVIVPLRFIAETFGCKVNYSNSTVTVETSPLVIDNVQVKALQHEYHMTMGGVVQQINGNAYNEAIYNSFIENKGIKVDAPAKYSWSVHDSEPGSYYKGGQFDFLDEKGNSVKRFDIYTLVRFGDPDVLIYDASEEQWYLFNVTARDSINQLINTTSINGFLTVISNTVV
ncbi:copper amine oxidase N-terminal domain-containing protein [Paenibacillus mendelii]|uniref:Copper amine oxidase N-terminal domain-containing protein n=1 Tax=Paenibacillus mendelii TaxID=206163 RepID=A0ABV6JDU6_9BACL|nr:copper amine oxidase N-terminal domain-containing protein [Paenibacillus mendelii]MCQ6563849.1 copper amine oxidase N-terminal domain-containing protein [Paenibacillus mendelii]